MSKILNTTLFFAPLLTTVAICTYSFDASTASLPANLKYTADNAQERAFQEVLFREEILPLDRKVEQGDASPEEIARLYRLNDEFLKSVKAEGDMERYNYLVDNTYLTSETMKKNLQKECQVDPPNCRQDIIDAIDALKDQPLRTPEEQASFDQKVSDAKAKILAGSVMPDLAGEGNNRADDCDGWGRKLVDIDKWTREAKANNQIDPTQSTAIRAVACSEYQKARAAGKNREDSAKIAKDAAKKYLDQLIKENKEKMARETAARREEARRRRQERQQRLQQEMASARQAITGQLGSCTAENCYKVIDYVDGAERETLVTDTLENAWDKDVPKMDGTGNNNSGDSASDTDTTPDAPSTEPKDVPTAPLFLLR